MRDYEINELRYVGSPCTTNSSHRYKDTGQSLRYKSGGACVVCQYYQSKYRRLDKDSAYNRWRRMNKANLNRYMRKYRERYADKKYQHEYYMRVTKPKRKKRREET